MSWPAPNSSTAKPISGPGNGYPCDSTLHGGWPGRLMNLRLSLSRPMGVYELAEGRALPQGRPLVCTPRLPSCPQCTKLGLGQPRSNALCSAGFLGLRLSVHQSLNEQTNERAFSDAQGEAPSEQSRRSLDPYVSTNIRRVAAGSGDSGFKLIAEPIPTKGRPECLQCREA